jgi:hypothetical protein
MKNNNISKLEYAKAIAQKYILFCENRQKKGEPIIGIIDFINLLNIKEITVEYLNEALFENYPELYFNIERINGIHKYSDGEVLKLANLFIEQNKEQNVGLRNFGGKYFVPRRTLRGLFDNNLQRLSKELYDVVQEIYSKNRLDSISEKEEMHEYIRDLATEFVEINNNFPMSLRFYTTMKGITRGKIRTYFEKVLPIIDPELSLKVRNILEKNQHNMSGNKITQENEEAKDIAK